MRNTHLSLSLHVVTRLGELDDELAQSREELLGRHGRVLTEVLQTAMQ
jgi:hypothetical protein